MGCGASKSERDAKNAPEDAKERAGGDDAAEPAAAGGGADTPSRIVIRGHELSQPCRAVQWYCRYAGLDVDIKYVDLGEGENKKADFVRRHPAGQVPALEEGAWCLSESTAILQYLAHDDASMQMKTAHERARLDWYFAYHTSTVRQLTTSCFNLFLFSPPRMENISPGYEAIKPILQRFDDMLATQDYVLGDRLTLADFMFVPEVDELGLLDGLLSPYPNITRYLDRIRPTKGYLETYSEMEKIVVELKRIKSWRSSVGSLDTGSKEDAKEEGAKEEGAKEDAKEEGAKEEGAKEGAKEEGAKEEGAKEEGAKEEGAKEEEEAKEEDAKDEAMGAAA